MNFKPYAYQQHALSHIIDNTGCGLFLEMGLGKTVITLTAIDHLLHELFEVTKVLIIAPLKVAEDTWISEVSKWDHLSHLKLSLVLGPEKKRKEALKAKADIYVINRENVAWLIGFYGTAFPFDMVVIDELSSFKDASSRRFKALRSIRPKVERVVGLTGTPAPNGLLDLWPQLYLLDQGERLGKTLTGYREKYFVPGKRNKHIVYEYNLRKPEAEEAFNGDDYYEKKIYDSISDICISMKTEDYLQLPKRIDRTRSVHLPDKVMQQYFDFEKKQVLALAESPEISAINAAALTNKLLQFANGAVYDDARNWHAVHGEKLDALAEDVEAANGEPVLIFYSYRHDLERILKHLKQYKPVTLENSATIKAWNQKQIPVLLAHPASAGHGLNMQHGGNIIHWFGCPWSLELYQQAIARLDRQGQIKPVLNNRLICRGTMDEDVLAALENKANSQEALMQAVKARIEKYSKR